MTVQAVKRSRIAHYPAALRSIIWAVSRRKKRLAVAVPAAACVGSLPLDLATIAGFAVAGTIVCGSLAINHRVRKLASWVRQLERTPVTIRMNGRTVSVPAKDFMRDFSQVSV